MTRLMHCNMVVVRRNLSETVARTLGSVVIQRETVLGRKSFVVPVRGLCLYN